MQFICTANVSTRGMFQGLDNFSQYIRNDVEERLLPKTSSCSCKAKCRAIYLCLFLHEELHRGRGNGLYPTQVTTDLLTGESLGSRKLSGPCPVSAVNGNYIGEFNTGNMMLISGCSQGIIGKIVLFIKMVWKNY